MPRNKELSRDAILASALELFGERGYGAVRVEDVANAAGVSRTTFYNHFSEREEILAALFERLLGREVGEAPEGSTPLERVRSLVLSAIEQMLAQEPLARFVYSLPVRHESLLKADRSSTPAVFRKIHHLIEEGVSRGEVRSDIPVDLLCIQVHAALENAMRAWAEGRTDKPLDRAAQLLELALDGITSTEAKRSSPTRPENERSARS